MADDNVMMPFLAGVGKTRPDAVDLMATSLGHALCLSEAVSAERIVLCSPN